MDPLCKEIIDAIQSSLVKKERQQLLIDFCKKNNITKDFFELLSASMIEEAKERKGVFLESIKEWSDIYATTVKELNKKEAENNKILSQQLLNVDMWDADAKRLALQVYSTRQTALYETYRKKIARLGAQYIKNISKKISEH